MARHASSSPASAVGCDPAHDVAYPARMAMDGGAAPDAGDGLPGLDLPAVTAWLLQRQPGLFRAPPRAQLVAGGRSNLTYLLDDGRRRVVLRRPPLGHVLQTAHDMGREFRVIGALAGTAVPVPQPVASCTDAGVTGAPFYVMSYVDGLVPRVAADVAGFGAARREQLATAMIDVLADLHAVAPATVGLADFGRPEGFLGRQLRRWSTQLEASRSRDLDGIESLRDGLTASLPALAGPAAGAIVHGDFRLDNLVVSGPSHPGPPTVRAVLDWEMSTLGDPLADLGLLLAYWDGLGGMSDPAVAPLGAGAGFPSGEVLAARYAARSGSDLTALPWYVAFGFFKIAVILEGIHYRFVQGQTVGAGFDRIAALVPDLVGLGLGALAAAGRGR